MIWVDNDQIGRCVKGEKIIPSSPARQLIIEWTAQL
jgi:hypothetical protein